MSAALPKWNGAAVEMGQQLKTISNIVIPLNGSAASRAAITVARDLVRLYAATPHLVYVGHAPMEPKNIHVLLAVTQEDIPGVVFHCCETESPEEIVRIARELPDAVIVICTHVGELVQSTGLGSFTEAVLASGPERIILVPPERADSAWGMQRILLAHSGTPDCDPATGMAAELATLTRAEVIALHVAAPKDGSPEEPGSLPAPRYIDQPQHEWPAWTGEFLDRMLAMGAPTSAVQFDLLVAGGQRGSEIAEKARERQADLVIMAWDREWQSEKHMATRTVIRSCGCPVLLVASNRYELSGGVIGDGPDAVVFDLDGVITFTARVHAAAWKQMFDEFLAQQAARSGEPFRPFENADYEAYVDGKPRYDGVASFLRSRNIDLPYGDPSDPPSALTVTGLGNRKNELFNRKVREEGVDVDKEAVRFVRELRSRGIATGIASSSKNAVPILEGVGIKDLFSAVVDGVVSERLHLRGKPQPDIFLTCLELLTGPPLRPERAVVAEDAIAGVEAGRRGGFGLVLGVDRNNSGALKANGADWVIHDFSEITVEKLLAFFRERARAA